MNNGYDINHDTQSLLSKRDNDIISKETPETSAMSPQEEIQMLRAKLAERKANETISQRLNINESDHAHDVINQYKDESINIHNTPNNKAVIADANSDYYIKSVMHSIGMHDTPSDKVLALGRMMLDNGIQKTLEAVAKMKAPELEDDFHRFLVQYLLSGHEDELRQTPKREWKSLHMRLYQIVLPDNNGETGKKGSREFIQMMEQYYASMQAMASDTRDSENDYYAMEIAIANNSNDVIFYTAVPNAMTDTFEKIVLGYFPDARVEECVEDYNIFHDGGYQVSSVARPHKLAAYPIMNISKKIFFGQSA